MTVDLRTPLLLVLCTAIAGAAGLWGGWVLRPAPPVDLPPLPADAVPVQIVPVIPGPAPVVERIHWRTPEVQVPEEVWREACPEAPRANLMADAIGPPPAPSPAPEARVEVRADRWEGAEGHGWTGEAACELRPAGGQWIELARAPIDLRVSSAIAERIELPRLPGLRTLGVGFTSDPGARVHAELWRRGRRVGAWASVDYRPTTIDPIAVGVGVAIRF